MTSHRQHTRSGLAPLELVLALPLLLFVMALMVVFGNAAYWKIRGATVARHAVWNTRYPRTGHTEPTPQNWRPGGMMREGDAELTMLDDPALQHAVVRGPLPNNFNVRSELLDPGRGARYGGSDLQRAAAMLPKLGDIKYDLRHPLLDDKFQYTQMGIPANTFRRIPFLYELPKADASLSGAFGDAVLAVMRAEFKGDLDPLDSDDEHYSWYGGSPNFYPRLGSFCSLDAKAVGNNQGSRLVDRVQGRGGRPRVTGVPDAMTASFLRMYRSMKRNLESQITTLQGQIADGTATAGAADELAALQAQVGGLDAKIQTLSDFQARLNARLAAR